MRGLSPAQAMRPRDRHLAMVAYVARHHAALAHCVATSADGVAISRNASTAPCHSAKLTPSAVRAAAWRDLPSLRAAASS